MSDNKPPPTAGDAMKTLEQLKAEAEELAIEIAIREIRGELTAFDAEALHRQISGNVLAVRLLDYAAESVLARMDDEFTFEGFLTQLLPGVEHKAAVHQLRPALGWINRFSKRLVQEKPFTETVSSKQIKTYRMTDEVALAWLNVTQPTYQEQAEEQLAW